MADTPGYTFHGYKGYACDGCGVYVHDMALHDLHCPQKLAEAAFKRQQEIYRREGAGYVTTADPKKDYTINERFEPEVGLITPKPVGEPRPWPR